MRLLVAITPLLGSISVALFVPYAISRIGLSAGVLSILIMSLLWFAFMLRTSEMPH